MSDRVQSHLTAPLTRRAWRLVHLLSASALLAASSVRGQDVGPASTECASALQRTDAELDSIDALSARGVDSAPTPAIAFHDMAARHRGTVNAMLRACDQQVRTLHGRERELQWVAAANALRKDAERLPGLTVTEVSRFLPAHEKRVARFVAIHRAVVGEVR